MKTCNKCYGTGVIGPMMNLLLRPPKEQKAYEDHVKSLQETCPECLGKGKIKDKETFLCSTCNRHVRGPHLCPGPEREPVSWEKRSENYKRENENLS